MGNTALIFFLLELAVFLLLGVGAMIIGGVYDVYLFFKYTYKGIKWIVSKLSQLRKGS